MYQDSLITNVPKVFDPLKRHNRLQRKRCTYKGWLDLWTEIAPRLVDRTMLHNINIHRILQIGWDGGLCLRALQHAHPQILDAFVIDASTHYLTQIQRPSILPHVHKIIGNEENWPLSQGSFDLVVVCGNTQWMNDIPGVIRQACLHLVEDGLFLMACIGGDSLQEIKIELQKIEETRYQGIPIRFDPLIHPRTMAQLLQRADLADPVSDIDHLYVRYSSLFDVFKDFSDSAIGSFTSHKSTHFLRRDDIREADKNLMNQYGYIPINLDIVYGLAHKKTKEHSLLRSLNCL